MPTNNGLVPLREAAQLLGVRPKTLRNRAARARAGLPGWSLPLVKLGARLFVATEDIDHFLDGLKNQHADDDPHAGLHRIADDIARLFPEHAETLRRIAVVIPTTPPRSRKRKPRAVLRRVGEPVADTGQDGVAP